MGSYPKWGRTQPNQGSQNNPPVTQTMLSLCFALRFPHTAVYPRCGALFPAPCEHTAAFWEQRGAEPGCLASFWLRPCRSSGGVTHAQVLTSAGVVLGSDAVATDSASSGDIRCENEGGGFTVREREFLVYWKFSRRDWTAC